MRTTRRDVSQDALDRGAGAHRKTARGGMLPSRPVLQEPARHAGRRRGDPADVTSTCLPRRSEKTSPRGSEALPLDLSVSWPSQMSPAGPTTRPRPRSRSRARPSTGPRLDAEVPGYLGAYGISEETKRRPTRTPPKRPAAFGRRDAQSRRGRPEKKRRSRRPASTRPRWSSSSRKRHRPALDVCSRPP